VFNLAGSMKLLRITFAIAFILLLIPGGYMAFNTWGWAPWVITGFVLLIVLSAAGNITGKKIVDILKSLNKNNEPLSIETKEKVSAPFFIKSYKIKILMAIGIVFIMTLKTGWIDTVITIAVSLSVGILLGIPSNAPVKEIESV
jgi:hypothetical protein